MRGMIAAGLALTVVAFSAAPGAAQSADPVGTWLRATGTSQIRIARCGAALCGTIVWLKEPNDPQTGKPKTDSMNPDPARRGRPLLGTRVVLGMQPTGKDGQWKGQVYKADEGKTYTGFLTMKSPGALDLEGCVMGGLICKSERLSRVR